MTETAQSALPRPMSLEDFKKTRASRSTTHKDATQKPSPLAKVAVWITKRVGSMGFFLIILGWTVFWLGWNSLAPKNMVFDAPMGFVFWLFISNVIQILLMPLIMVGQNVVGAQSNARAERDLEINVQAEKEIEVILQHLEYQNDLLIKMMKGVEQNIGGSARPT